MMRVRVPDLDYYDKILLGITGSVLGGVVLGAVSSLSIHVGAFLGALVATLFVYAGAFRNPPLPETQPRVKAAVVVWHVVLLVTALVIFL